jgi:hypothetical protein
LVCLSFFKENKIGYYYDDKNQQVIFNCHDCSLEVILDLMSTNWQCKHCGVNGNLKTLINLQVKGSLNQQEVFKPELELKRMKDSFNELRNIIQEKGLKMRFNNLITRMEFFMENMEKRSKVK